MFSKLLYHIKALYIFWYFFFSLKVHKKNSKGRPLPVCGACHNKLVIKTLPIKTMRGRRVLATHRAIRISNCLKLHFPAYTAALIFITLYHEIHRTATLFHRSRPWNLHVENKPSHIFQCKGKAMHKPNEHYCTEKGK